MTLCLLALHSFATSQDSTMLTGAIKDAITGVPLSYASVSVKGTYIGATSDEQGIFKLRIQNADPLAFLEVNYVGYVTSITTISEFQSTGIIELEPNVHTLGEVIVRPLSPEELLRRVSRKIDQNYANFSFNTLASYEEVIKENTALIDHSEAVFKSWFKEFNETVESQHHLALYREKETEELQFMRDRAEKEKKKYLKKNPEATDRFEDDDILLTNFGGPKSIMNLNVVNNSLECLDTLNQHKYRFRYLPESTYQDNVLIVIEYESKGKVDYRKQNGRLYIDSSSDAIVKVEEEGELVLPLIAKPILFVMGIHVRKPLYRFNIKYREVNNRWYPEYSQWNVQLDLTKKKTFSKNQRSRFEIQQQYVVYDIITESVMKIDTDKLFAPSEKMSDQVHPIGGISWDRFED